MNFDNHKLNLNSIWRIGEESFFEIVNLIEQKFKIPNHIMEFGSGASSIRLALNFPKTNIISIDADLECYNETQQLAQEFLNQQDNFELQYKQLIFQKYGLGKILSYTPDSNWQKLNFDCVIIDGPPFYTLRGREACLYQIYEQLVIGGIVILDDFNRESEKIILQNWLSVYPNSFTVKIIEIGHHLAVLEKNQSVKPDWDNEFKSKDSIEINDKYQKLQNALSNFEISDISDILNSLPSNFVIPYINNKDNLDDFLKLMLTIKNCYNIDTKNRESITQNKHESFCDCLELLNLLQK